MQLHHLFLPPFFLCMRSRPCAPAQLVSPPRPATPRAGSPVRLTACGRPRASDPLPSAVASQHSSSFSVKKKKQNKNKDRKREIEHRKCHRFSWPAGFYSRSLVSSCVQWHQGVVIPPRPGTSGGLGCFLGVQVSPCLFLSVSFYRCAM
jgi:hypothetical protein